MIVPGISFVQGRNVYTDKDGAKYGIAIHNTSNTASARAEAKYATVRTDTVSAHFFVDNVEVIQSLDTRSKAGHAGSSTGNENAIAIEIVGMNDRPRDWWLANVVWDKLAAVLAQVIRVELPGFQVRRASVAEMKANPKVRAFYAHDDMRQAWGGTTHDDPGPNFPWDRLFDSLNRAVGAPAQHQEDDVAQILVRFSDAPDPNQVWLCDGLTRRKVDPAWVVDGGPISGAQIRQPGLLGPLANGGKVFVSHGDPDVWGAEYPPPAVQMDAAAVASALVADPAFRRALADAAFEGSQRAERE